jgi:hypothetical protein
VAEMTESDGIKVKLISADIGVQSTMPVAAKETKADRCIFKGTVASCNFNLQEMTRLNNGVF